MATKAKCLKCVEYLMRQNKLEKENARLMLQLSRDEVTGVYSRFGFSETAKYLISSLRERKKKSGERRLSHVNDDNIEHLALLFIDLDNFKPINDTLGHEGGDQLLTTFAEFLETQVRHADIVGRLGGDEFVVLLTEDNLLSGKKVAKKIRDIVKDFIFHIDSKKVFVDFSCGVSSTSEGVYDLKKLMRKADLRMYEDKKRNK